MSPPPSETPSQVAREQDAVNERPEQTCLLVDARAAAAMLAIGARTLWSLTKCDAVPSRRIGRAVRYCPTELRAWIGAGCPTEPGSAASVRKGVIQ
ncbi:MAG: hypothetical protein AAGI30_13990 [Planctomycetota bacterium]